MMLHPTQELEPPANPARFRWPARANFTRLAFGTRVAEAGSGRERITVLLTIHHGQRHQEKPPAFHFRIAPGLQSRLLRGMPSDRGQFILAAPTVHEVTPHRPSPQRQHTVDKLECGHYSILSCDVILV
jgi:hypothetical protein